VLKHDPTDERLMSRSHPAPEPRHAVAFPHAWSFGRGVFIAVGRMPIGHGSSQIDERPHARQGCSKSVQVWSLYVNVLG